MQTKLSGESVDDRLLDALWGLGARETPVREDPHRSFVGEQRRVTNVHKEGPAHVDVSSLKSALRVEGVPSSCGGSPRLGAPPVTQEGARGLADALSLDAPRVRVLDALGPRPDT